VRHKNCTEKLKVNQIRRSDEMPKMQLVVQYNRRPWGARLPTSGTVHGKSNPIHLFVEKN